MNALVLRGEGKKKPPGWGGSASAGSTDFYYYFYAPVYYCYSGYGLCCCAVARWGVGRKGYVAVNLLQLSCQGSAGDRCCLHNIRSLGKSVTWRTKKLRFAVGTIIRAGLVNQAKSVICKKLRQSLAAVCQACSLKY